MAWPPWVIFFYVMDVYFLSCNYYKTQSISEDYIFATDKKIAPALVNRRECTPNKASCVYMVTNSTKLAHSVWCFSFVHIQSSNRHETGEAYHGLFDLISVLPRKHLISTCLLSQPSGIQVCELYSNATDSIRIQHAWWFQSLKEFCAVHTLSASMSREQAGGFNSSGLRASRISSGGECHRRGCHVSPVGRKM